MSVYCTTSFCQKAVVNASDVCFYKQSDRQCHLCLKPERLTFIPLHQEEKQQTCISTPLVFIERNEPTNNAFESSQCLLRFIRRTHVRKSQYSPLKVQCAACQTDLGCQVKIGPENELLVTLKSGQVSFNREAGTRLKRKWASFLLNPQQQQEAPAVEVRDMATIMTGKECVAPDIVEPFADREILPTHFPTLAESMDWYLNDITGKLTPRDYQLELFLNAIHQNSIAFLPTGAGKTLVSILVLKNMLYMNPSKKIFFLVDRVPLVFQQSEAIMNEVGPGVQVLAMCGENSSWKVKREAMETENNIIVCTAEIFEHMLSKVGNSQPLCNMCRDISLIIFDEAHHAYGKKNVYRRIMEKYYPYSSLHRPLILSMTASPCGDISLSKTEEKLKELTSLYEAQIYMPVFCVDSLRQNSTSQLEDWIEYKPTFLENEFEKQLWGYIFDLNSEISAALGGKIHGLMQLSNFRAEGVGIWKGVFRKAKDCVELACRAYKPGSTQYQLYAEGLELITHLLQFLDCLEQLEINGPIMTEIFIAKYFNNMKTSKPNIYLIIERMAQRRIHISHLLGLKLSTVDRFEERFHISSKVNKVIEEIRKTLLNEARIDGNPGIKSRILVFVNKVSKVEKLVLLLNKVEGIRELRPQAFIGHGSNRANHHGMAWRGEQSRRLNLFRSGWTRLLVSTTVLEEGLDVSSCNLVIRFDENFTLTGFVQSRGRARHIDSRIVILCREKMTEIKKQEKNMYVAVESMMGSDRNQQHVRQNEIAEALVKMRIASKIPEKLSKVKQQRSLPIHVRNTVELNILINTPIWKELNERELHGGLNALFNSLETSFSANVVSQTNCVISLRLKNSDVPQSRQTIEYTYDTLLLSLKASLVNLEHSALLFDVRNMWFHYAFNAKPEQQSTVIYRGNRLRRGWLETRSRFIEQQKYFGTKEGCLTLAVLDSCIRIEVIRENFRPLRADFPIDAIDSYLFLSHDPEIGVSLIIPMLQSPFISELYSKFSSYARQAIDCSGPLVFAVDLVCNDLKDLWPLRRILWLKFSMQLFDCFVISLECDASFLPEETSLGDAKDSSLDFCVDWFVSIHSHIFPKQQLLTTIWKFISKHCSISADIWTMLLTNLSLSRFEALTNLLEDELTKLLELNSLVKNCEFSSVNKGTSDYVNIFILVVTPSRTIVNGCVPMCQNRVLRQFSNKHDFIIVHFRDEDLSHFDFGQTELLKRVEAVLDCGILFGNQQFHFLGPSNSQLKQRCAWFTTGAPCEIRNWIGDFSSFKNVGKYTSRLGMAFASSVEALPIPFETMKKKNFIQEKQNEEFVFSDGIGIISPEFASLVWLKICSPMQKVRCAPSAFQIRVGGFKGVLAVHKKENAPVISFRQSMYKFDSLNHNVLEVLNYSKMIPCFLNRQIIMLLKDLGVKEEYFIELQENQLRELRELFVDHDKATQKIQQYLPTFKVAQLVSHNINILEESFTQSLLQAIYTEEARQLSVRARIFVPKGRVMMGIIDEFDVLENDEVYFTYTSKDLLKLEELTDGTLVMVTRNPCHHPGDIQVLKFRSKRLPKAMKNNSRDCVVFSSHGQRPIPNMCSGGDLDGDNFTVIWDKKLIPPESHPPMHLEKIGHIDNENSYVTEQDLKKFFVSYISHYQLGILANAHLVLIDHIEGGSRNAKSLALAEAIGHEVDFPKTGLHPNLAGMKFRPEKYPDFMEKPAVISYISKNILGKLYRNVHTLDTFPLCVNPYVDDIFLINGYMRFIDTAVTYYDLYVSYLKGIMNRYDIKTEAELLMGIFPRKSRCISGKVESIKMEVSLLWTKFLDFFESQSLAEDRKKMASAWYYVSYRTTSENYLSFPWIVQDYLLQILKDKQTQSEKLSTHVDNNFLSNVNQLLWKLFEDKKPILVESYYEREILREKLENYISGTFTTYKLIIFGSTKSFLFDETTSDVDLFLFCSEDSKRQIDLEAVMDPLSVEYVGLRHVSNGGKNEVIRFEDINGGTSFDISNSVDGLQKLWILRKYYEQYSFFFPCLFFLTQWGRANGLIRRGSTPKMFTSIGFAFLFIEFCIDMKFILHRVELTGTEFNCSQIYEAEHSENWFDSLQYDISGYSGLVFVNFFEYFSAKKICIIDDPINKFKPATVLLNLSDVSVFQEKCKVALHYLYFSNGCDPSYLLQTCNAQHHRVIRLSRSLSCRIAGSEEFHSKKIVNSIESRCGSKPLQVSFAPVGSRLVVTINGEGGDVKKASDQIDEMDNFLKNYHSQRCSVFVEDAMLFLFEGAIDDSQQVKFNKYYGKCHRIHETHELYCPVLLEPIHGGNSWQMFALKKFEKSIVAQKGKYLKMHTKSTSTLKKIHAVIRFGRQYIMNLSNAFLESISFPQVEALENEMERGRQVLMPWLEEQERRHSEAMTQVSKPNPTKVVSVKTMTETNAQKWRKDEVLKQITSKTKGATQSFTTSLNNSNYFQIEEYLTRQLYSPTPVEDCVSVSFLYNQVEYSLKLHFEESPTSGHSRLLKFSSLARRRRRWLAGNFISCEAMVNSNNVNQIDARFYIDEQEDLSETHDLFKLIVSVTNRTILSLDDSGKRKLSVPHDSPLNDKKIKIVKARHVSKCASFSKAGRDETFHLARIWSYDSTDGKRFLQGIEATEVEIWHTNLANAFQNKWTPIIDYSHEFFEVGRSFAYDLTRHFLS